ncbi:hypothetical protein ACKKBG_A35855 [Auxenochlorella protothecoides x Auxenochlorella symbiontica]
MPVEKGALASRSQRLLDLKPAPHFEAFMKGYMDQWSQDNPEGYVLIAVAENKLHSDAFAHRMQEALARPLPDWVMNYTMMTGDPRLQEVLAALLRHTFLKGFEVRARDLVISNGVTPLLDHLFFTLADAGEGVLIPAPYYPSFDMDLMAKDDVVPVPFYLVEDGDVTAQLAQAAAAAAEAGSPIRALLITNPNNPLGIVYSTATLKAMLEWSVKNGVHLVSDEIYALSVHGEATFVSMQRVAQGLVEEGALTQEGVDTHLHLLWGMSKDFGGSGLRLGVLHTRSASLKKVFGSISPFSQASNLLQYALTVVLSDLDWVDAWVAENQRQLALSYSAFSAALTEAGIPFTPATSAMFVWLDLRKWLPKQGWEGEAALWQRICDEARVVVTTGHSCHAAEPGYFRVCFAWVPAEALVVAATRLSAVLDGAADT